jgi:large subunit ribosomal protein L4
MPREAQEPGPVKLPLYSDKREQVGEIELSGMVFGRDGNPALLHDAVRMQLANRRSGTAATKTRGFISGGGKKPWRQKGTGRARAGSIRSPLWRHGGTIFGPQPRDYSYTIPKKAWRQALCLAISDRVRDGKAKVIQSLSLTEPKTKAAKALLDSLGLVHALILIGDGDEGFARAARNLAAHKLLPANAVNVYDVLNYNELLMTEKTARDLDERLRGGRR